MPRALRCALAALLVAGAATLDARAQTPRQPSGPVEALVQEGDVLHGRHRPLDALETFQRVLRSRPGHFDSLWRAAREAVALGMLTGDGEARATWFREAEGYAERAVDVRPEAVEGHHWLSVALGRRAEDEGPRTRVNLARRVREEASFVLERDSLHAGAHEVLGRWNAEIMRMNRVTRFLADKLLGADTFDEASWEAAERHLRLAIELEPAVLLHRLALARVLRDTDRGDEAREQLREVLERPALDPVDPVVKQRAQELLRGL